jgi:hypothetical protein
MSFFKISKHDSNFRFNSNSLQISGHDKQNLNIKLKHSLLPELKIGREEAC